MSEQYNPNLHGTYEQPPMNSADRSRRRTKYRRIRSTARDNYMQNCGYGRPPLPQNLGKFAEINGDVF
ncbi:hypothetical protein DPMN_063186 [Dreissena polymorpha]|uniref:Uncharacterized protein n=1 Tax=Dreissena polymorpha TaxID=45954 RepID=A0A9D4HJX2_DREPO|nr:hypothetical protein DPMN_063186 [Dreissena polymorpha]